MVEYVDPEKYRIPLLIGLPFPYLVDACSVLAENSGGKYRFTDLGLDHVVFAVGKSGSVYVYTHTDKKYLKDKCFNV